MLIRPHDAGTEAEAKALLNRHQFGLLIAPGLGRELPVVVPTHVVYDGAHHIRLHLARPNPIWQALAENTRCMFTVVAPFTYVPTSWEAVPGTAPEWGIPTSHYATVQLRCTARITDDEAEIRRILAEQLHVMQPDEPYGDPTSPDVPYSHRTSPDPWARAHHRRRDREAQVRRRRRRRRSHPGHRRLRPTARPGRRRSPRPPPPPTPTVELMPAGGAAPSARSLAPVGQRAKVVRGCGELLRL